MWYSGKNLSFDERITRIEQFGGVLRKVGETFGAIDPVVFFERGLFELVLQTDALDVVSFFLLVIRRIVDRAGHHFLEYPIAHCLIVIEMPLKLRTAVAFGL